MILPDERILAGLRHANRILRQEMLEYLADFSQATALHTREVLAAIDQFGWDNAFQYTHQIAHLPTDEHCLQWALSQLQRRGEQRPTSLDLASIARMITNADPYLVRPYLDTILAFPEFTESPKTKLDPWRTSNQKLILQRQELAELSPEECWHKLQQETDSIETQVEFPHASVQYGELLIERIASNVEPYKEEVLRSLSHLAPPDQDCVREDWWRGFMIILAGQARIHEASELLLNQFATDWEWYDTEINDALSRIGTLATAQLCVDRYPDVNIYTRMSLSDVLKKIHQNGIVQLITPLLDIEEDLEVRWMLGIAVSSHFDPSGIGPAMSVYQEYPDDDDYAGILNQTFACAALSETHTEEATVWQLRIEKAEEIRARRGGRGGNKIISWMEDLQAVASESAPPELNEDAWEEPVSDELDEADDDFEEWEAPQPIVRDQVRVGRNELCPCGSKKKYKKCCLKASK